MLNYSCNTNTMNNEMGIGLLYTAMYNEAKKRYKELGYVPDRNELILNSKELRSLVKRWKYNDVELDDAYDSSVEDLENE